jgi:hypothetical protein
MARIERQCRQRNLLFVIGKFPGTPDPKSAGHRGELWGERLDFVLPSHPSAPVSRPHAVLEELAPCLASDDVPTLARAHDAQKTQVPRWKQPFPSR